MALIDIKVPDIGDFAEVTVIELMVKAGDTIKPDQSLLTVESDKASMEIPSSHGGVVKELKVKLGDKVKEGTIVLTLEAAGSADSAPNTAPAPVQSAPVATKTVAPVAPPAAAGAPAPAGASYAGAVDLDCDLLVLGAGPGGYSAAFRAADLGLKVILVERYAQLGGVCLNVGCIPSKALLHVAAVMDEVSHLGALGIEFGAPKVNVDTLRGHKEKVINKLTGGLAAMAKMRKVTVVRGYGAFVGANHVQVEETTGAQGQEKTGTQKVIGFKKAIIAAGSQAVRLPFMPEDPRVVDSTGALALKEVPKRMLILGGGIIGLEMGTVYSTLGARLDVVEMMDGLMQGADRDLVKIWQKMNAPRFDNIMLKTKTVGARALPEGIEVTFAAAEEGGTAPAPQVYDLVLQAVGRTPNGKKIAADKAGVAVTDRGFINVDIQMRTNVPHIFAIGDIVGQPMLAHKA
ncbi:MAG: dihydrolipoyl dehydrogenase, partial [Pseudomonadota bacterium]